MSGSFNGVLGKTAISVSFKRVIREKQIGVCGPTGLLELDWPPAWGYIGL